MKNRILSVLLLTSILLAACGGGSSGGETTAPSSESTTDEPVETKLDDLPELDFNSEKVTIFCTDYEDFDSYNYMTREESNGDVVNDAIYNRNKSVDERLNVTTEWIRHIFDYSSRNEMYTAVRTSVMSGDSYDVIMSPTYFNTTIIAEGLLTDIAELPHVDLTKPYWFSGFNETAQLGGKTYMAAGDGALPYITGLFCFAVNMDMAEINKIDNIYELVDSGKWTLDAMNELVSSLYRDLNGDATVDIDDQFGLESVNANFLYPFLISAGGSAITLADDGYQFTYDSERTVDIYDKTFTLLHESGNGSFLSETHRANKRAEAPFVQGRSLFSAIMLLDTVYYRDLTFTYSVVPYPKFDENQERYYSCASNGVPVFMVPITSKESEKVGALLEALNSEGYKTTTPAYYEIALKTKYSYGDDMSRMFDIIRESEYMSVPCAFAAELGGLHDEFKLTVCDASNSGVWASTAANLKDSTMQKLDKLIRSVS